MKYNINIEVTTANGYQVVQVEANSKEDALKKFNDGGGDIIEHEVEVESICEVTIDNVEEA